MGLRILRAGVGLLLVTAGTLMYAASWQRWAGTCGWGQAEGRSCLERQDHLYDFVAPTSPWEPVGSAAQLAGGSMLVLAIAFALLPWALTGIRPGRIACVVLAGAVVAQGAVGAATLASGISGGVVRPVTATLAVYLWLLWPPALLVRFAFSSRGWTLAGSVALALATPLVAAVSYAVGPYDARPWWEAISGGFTATAGLCLLVAAALGTRPRPPQETATEASPPPSSRVGPRRTAERLSGGRMTPRCRARNGAVSRTASERRSASRAVVRRSRRCHTPVAAPTTR